MTTEVTSDMKKVHEELLRTNEEFKHEVKNGKDNVERIAKGLLDLQSEIKDIKTSIVETKVTDRVREGAEKSKEEKAFWGFIKTGNDAEYRAIKSTQGLVGTSADGGYAVPVVLDTNLTNLLLEYSDIRSIAKVVQIGPSTGYIHTIGQANAGTAWEGESSLPTSNVPTLGQVTIVPGTLTASPEASQQMIEDVFFDAEAWFIQQVLMMFAVAEGTAFVNGSGTNQPKGILQYSTTDISNQSNPPVYTTLNTIASYAANAINFEDVYALPYALKPLYRKGGCYVMNRGILSQVMQLKSTTGQPLWQPSMVAGQPGLLNGYKVVEAADYPVATSSESATLAMTFGDFSKGYTVVDRIGTTVLRNPYINQPFIRFQTRKRVGGGLEDGNALVTLSVTA